MYALDGLAASGIRARRWLNELPANKAERLDVAISDLDKNSLSWAMRSHDEFPPVHGEGISDKFSRGPQEGSSGTWPSLGGHRPIRLPLPFLDVSLQSLARSGVIEVSATDTSALTGSSRGAMLRRYGSRVRTDGLAHDSALRVMMGNLARTAARHDRAIKRYFPSGTLII